MEYSHQMRTKTGSPSPQRKKKTMQASSSDKFKLRAPLTKSSLEPIREKMGKYIFSLPGEPKIEHK